MAKVCRIRLSTVIEAIKSLEGRFIEVERGENGQGSRYRITFKTVIPNGTVSDDAETETVIPNGTHRYPKRNGTVIPNGTKGNPLRKSIKDRSVSSSKGKASTPEEVEAYAIEQGQPKSDGDWFFDSMEAGGWKRNGEPIADWKAHFRSYKKGEWLPSQKINGNGKSNRDDFGDTVRASLSQ